VSPIFQYALLIKYFLKFEDELYSNLLVIYLLASGLLEYSFFGYFQVMLFSRTFVYYLQLFCYNSPNLCLLFSLAYQLLLGAFLSIIFVFSVFHNFVGIIHSLLFRFPLEVFSFLKLYLELFFVFKLEAFLQISEAHFSLSQLFKSLLSTIE